MATADAFLAPGGRAREVDDGLGDVVAGVGDDEFAERLDPGLVGRRPHEHAVSAGFVGGLDDEFRQVVEDVFHVVRLGGEIGLDVRQDGILAEVVADDFGDEAVDHLVVGDAGADGVGERDVAGAVGAHEAGDAERGVLAEDERVEEIVVDAAVDHIDADEAVDGPHVNEIIDNDEVAALDDFDAHFAREVAVLEVGAVEAAGREQDADRFALAVGGDVVEHVDEVARVAFHRADLHGFEDARERAFQGVAVFEEV